MTLRLSVPGNLLLAGEYAVLEEGGLGLALAVEPRLTVTVTEAAAWSLEGRWQDGSERWSPGGRRTFAAQVLQAVLERTPGAAPASFVVDSSLFFDAGRKRGFGSSAALAVGLAAAAARLAGTEPDPLTAVEAHRYAQGGTGSGYDVLASWFGGYGLVEGGARPRWRPLTAELPFLTVFAGPEAVRTTGSVARYRTWKTAHPEDARRFLDDSNAAVKALSQAAGSWREAAERTRLLGIAVGRTIGSSAELTAPADASDAFIKALGAGNETGLAAFAKPVSRQGLTPLTVAGGWRWE